ncbi:MAG TPA: carboxymethylenebutenolidase, partial [Parasutterella excrementihominis]|nr:carboxymethylenebutenolidase [Parasutterella excrementihominis]
RQFASLKRKQIEALIHRYLAGEKVLDPNLPTYAMMAYMAVVSARLLPRDSVCRRTVEDEIIFTDADRRLCNQEVADLWQRADSNPKFDKTMDNVVEELTKHGVDVSMINQAASSLD